MQIIIDIPDNRKAAFKQYIKEVYEYPEMMQDPSSTTGAGMPNDMPVIEFYTGRLKREIKNSFQRWMLSKENLDTLYPFDITVE